MSDLKEFLETNGQQCINIEGVKTYKMICSKDLGLFFWDRGGKQFVIGYAEYCLEGDLESISIKELQEEATNNNKLTGNTPIDFLDCLACLGEEQVKKLIEKERCGVDK